ncbi:MAG: DUF1788 domain-containing protein [Deltaproteobacteria bacterium]|nr:DUF1788 domain-containing protein [Deltaproteobacteria bacterium]
MSRVDRLLKRYQRFVELPWDQQLAGPQRVWFVIYDKTDERRIRARIGEFELATKGAGHGWQLVDLTDSFPHWMAGQEYRESYFRSPEDLDILLSDFRDQIIQNLEAVLTNDGSTTNSIVAVMGIASLFGFLKVSEVINTVANNIRGRLLVFFPGEYENNNYRLLDARDGWNYLSVPITADEGM